MDSRVSFKEIFFMLCIIMSFAVTGLFIMQENYNYSLIGLTAAAVSVLLEFWATLSENSRVIDLSGSRSRIGRGGKVKTYNSVNPGVSDIDYGSIDDELGGMNDTGDFVESVGNLRVYKRDEEDFKGSKRK